MNIIFHCMPPAIIMFELAITQSADYSKLSEWIVVKKLHFMQVLTTKMIAQQRDSYLFISLLVGFLVLSKSSSILGNVQRIVGRTKTRKMLKQIHSMEFLIVSSWRGLQQVGKLNFLLLLIVEVCKGAIGTQVTAYIQCNTNEIHIIELYVLTYMF